MPQEGAVVYWLVVRGGLKSKPKNRNKHMVNYMEVMSLRAWSSSSLMALYFSFWAYNSSIGGRVGWREGGVVRKGAWVKGRHDKEVKG